MLHHPWEVVILKPTAVFLSFLALQLPDVDLPELPLLHTDCTAYIIRKQKNDEETLNEIERHFSFMFRHEMCRWLGSNARNEIEGSFLDFLCCFKFEIHSQIVLMEDFISDNSYLLRVKPRTVLCQWMKSAIEEKHTLTPMFENDSAASLTEDATVIVKDFSNLAEVQPFLNHYYKPLFEAEMARMCEEGDPWPKIDSYQTFSRYFSINIHSQLIHLH